MTDAPPSPFPAPGRPPRARKSLAQYWLRQERYLKAIVAAADLHPLDSLLEIGPGTGNLTQHLLPQVNALIAVELDARALGYLRRRWPAEPKLWLVEGDILELNLTEHLATRPAWPPPRKVVANIPYNITGPLLETLLGNLTHPNPWPWERLVLLVQKEVAERLTAGPGNRTFGALTVRLQYLAHCELLQTVPARAFHPKPQVDSAIIRLRPRPFDPVAQQPRLLHTLLNLGFNQRRKMLRNTLESLVLRDTVVAALEAVGAHPEARPEALGVTEWVNLSNWLATHLSSAAPNPSESAPAGRGGSELW